MDGWILSRLRWRCMCARFRSRVRRVCWGLGFGVTGMDACARVRGRGRGLRGWIGSCAGVYVCGGWLFLIGFVYVKGRDRLQIF